MDALVEVCVRARFVKHREQPASRGQGATPAPNDLMPFSRSTPKTDGSCHSSGVATVKDGGGRGGGCLGRHKM